MYKRLNILILALLALVSCTKEQAVEEVTLQLRATIDSDVTVLTRTGEVEAQTVAADHAVFQAWKGDVMAAKAEQSIEPGTTQISFSGIKLVAGAEYLIYIWVDCNGYYNTTDLRTVSVNSQKSYDGKNSQFDAFYCCSSVTCGQNDGIHEVTLKRPFAKVCFSAQVPSQLNVKFTAPTTFNLKTGEVSGARAVSYTVQPGESSVTAFDYVFATDELSQLGYTFKLGDEEQKSTSVPVKRNTKTNIIYNITN